MGGSKSQVAEVEVSDDMLNQMYKKFTEIKDAKDEDTMAKFLTEQGFEIPPRAFKAMFALADKNQDHRMQPEEFLPFLKILLFTETFEEIIFKCADLDGSGYINKQEMQVLKSRLGLSVPDEKVPEKMTFVEFLPLIRAYLSQ